MSKTTTITPEKTVTFEFLDKQADFAKTEFKATSSKLGNHIVLSGKAGARAIKTIIGQAEMVIISKIAGSGIKKGSAANSFDFQETVKFSWSKEKGLK